MITVPSEIYVETDELTLRTPQPNDLDQLREHSDNRIITQYFSDPLCPNDDESAERLLKYVKKQEEESNPDEFHAAIEVDGEAIGEVMLLDLEAGHKGEIAYWLGEDYWGNGVAPHAVKHFTNFAFNKFELKRIFALVQTKNKRSAKLLKKNGYRFEGILKNNFAKNGHYFDDMVYAKVR